jgi:enolase
LKSLIDFFGCGQTYSYKDYVEFRCQSFKDNYEKILPFFNKYPIIGVKSRDFEDWAKVAKMIQKKVHLTNEGFDQIRQIRTGMNKGRYLK